MRLAGHNPALFLKLFYFYTHGLFPKANCTNGLVSLRLCIGFGSKTQIPLGPRLSIFCFNLRPMITSFLEQGIFETVVDPNPIILAMWMFSIRLNHRTHTPILVLKMVTGSPEIPEEGKGRSFALKDRV